jgi:hypothetical protein
MQIVVADTCHYCRQARNPVDIIPLPGGIKICQGCYQQHQAGVLAMSGLRVESDGTFSSVAPPPPECSECHLSVEELRARGHGVMMAVHFENGLYRVMCLYCSDTYVQKRKDLYGPTEYGFKYKLN